MIDIIRVGENYCNFSPRLLLGLRRGGKKENKQSSLFLKLSIAKKKNTFFFVFFARNTESKRET